MSSAASKPPSSRRQTGTEPVRTPHIKLTRYDIMSSALISAVGMLGLTLIVLIAIWVANMLPTQVLLAPIMTAGDGGWEDGVEGATPDVESPEDPTDDPSVAEDMSDVTELMEITDPVVEVSDTAAQLVEPTEYSGEKNTGNPGSAEGTGGRPLGSGGPGRGGAKRDQRWFVQFAEKGNLKSYAQQLDFFGIELGALFLSEGRLVYLKNVSQDQPVTREVTTGDAEKRLFMNWEDGDRKEADAELFQKAGVDARQAAILHFYPDALEQQMARLELSYANRPSAQILRTYFEIRRSDDGFEFVVTSQKLK